MPLLPSRKNAATPDSDSSSSNRPSDWLDRLARLQTHFGRYLWDILGVLLCAFALMTLLGILKLSKGSLLVEWVNLLNIGFGWGDLLIVLLIAAGGILAFRESITIRL